MKTMAMLKKFWSEEDGGETVEWPLLVALIAVGADRRRSRLCGTKLSSVLAMQLQRRQLSDAGNVDGCRSPSARPDSEAVIRGFEGVAAGNAEQRGESSRDSRQDAVADISSEINGDDDETACLG